MATRMQQRRGTAAQWISTNSGNGPILNAGEIGWESDTNKFKIGDGTNTWLALDYFSDTNSTVNPAFGSSITFEGATANDYETVLAVTDPTADRTITLPNVDGTVITTGNLSDITNIGVFTSTITMEGSSADDNELTLSAGNPTADRTLTFPDATDTLVGKATTDTLTNKSISLTTNTVTGTKAEFNSAMSDADFATIAGTETLTNKTLTSPTVSGLALSDASIVIEGATANAYKTTLTVTDPTANRTITFPDSDGTVALAGDVATSLSGYILSSLLGDPSGPAALNGTGNLLVPGTKIIFEGDHEIDNDFETELVIVNPTADVTITFPDATGTVALAGNVAALSGATFTGAVSGTDLTLSGNLTVNGTTTNINSTNLVVEDKNIVLADVASPTDTTADGGGITLKGATDKTFNWVDSTDAWTSSEHINLASGKTLKYNGTDLVAAQSGNSGKYLTTDGTSTSWGTVTGYSAPTLGSTSIASGATVTTISGLTDIVLDGPGSVKDELTLLLMGAL
jgi:tetrahydromethanopterin S-methyltransferase subunit B